MGLTRHFIHYIYYFHHTYMISPSLYPRNLKFRGYYGFGPEPVSTFAAAAARQGLCFT